MVKPIPEGNNTVSPYLMVENVNKMIDFLKNTFDAKEKDVISMPDGSIMHCEIKIGDTVVMIGQTSPESNKFTPMLHVYVEDCEIVYKKSLEAGAKTIQELTEQFYGDKNVMITDPFGNYWCIATRIKEVSVEEMQKLAQERSK